MLLQLYYVEYNNNLIEWDCILKVFVKTQIKKIALWFLIAERGNFK